MATVTGRAHRTSGQGGSIIRPSPNFGARRDGLLPALVVLHFTGMQGLDAALERLCDPAVEVSAHYLIATDGRVFALVPEPARAWHAGAGSWGGHGDVNSRSIGIELDNPGDRPFSEPQMTALEDLLAGVMARWRIAPQGVIGHADMAPERKHDPGSRLDWRRLALAGLSVWPDTQAADGAGGWSAFLAAAARFGYPADARREAVLAAFRARFRPWVRGVLDTGDVAAARDLAARYGIDRAGTGP